MQNEKAINLYIYDLFAFCICILHLFSLDL